MCFRSHRVAAEDASGGYLSLRMASLGVVKASAVKPKQFEVEFVPEEGHKREEGGK